MALITPGLRSNRSNQAMRALTELAVAVPEDFWLKTRPSQFPPDVQVNLVVCAAICTAVFSAACRLMSQICRLCLVCRLPSPVSRLQSPISAVCRLSSAVSPRIPSARLPSARVRP